MCNLFIEKDMIKDVSFRKGKHFLEDHVYIFTMDKLIDLEHRRKEQRDKDQLEQIAKSPKTVSDISPSPTSLEVKPIPKPTAPILILSPHTSVNAIGSTGHEKSRSPIATTPSTFSDVKSSGEKKKVPAIDINAPENTTTSPKTASNVVSPKKSAFYRFIHVDDDEYEDF